MIAKLSLAILAFLAVACTAELSTNNVVCYYDTKGSFRTGDASFHPKYLAEAAQYCTHLVYGYAAINPKTFCIEPLNPSFDIDQYKTYQEVVGLRTTYPHLRIILSVGGGRDLESLEKYLTILEYPEKRSAFVASAAEFVHKHGFDGIDLAWQFPPNKPRIVSSGFWSSAWNTIKSPFIHHGVDSKAHEHKQQFVELVSELKKNCRNHGLSLSLSVLPNVNTTLFFNVPELIPNLDLVHLWAFDYYTGERNPKEADYPAPLYDQMGRRYEENGDYLVHHWCECGAPSQKLVLAIPTFARTWKVTNPDARCMPPVLDVDGPGHQCGHTKEHGILSYPEVYHKLKEHIAVSGVATTIKDGFKNYKYATYALLASDHSKVRDIWAGYEDPDTANYKATFARLKKLGGVALIDLTLDDFKGLCTGIKYPILRSVLATTDGGEPKVAVTTIPSLGPSETNTFKPEIPVNNANVANADPVNKIDDSANTLDSANVNPVSSNVDAGKTNPEVEIDAVFNKPENKGDGSSSGGSATTNNPAAANDGPL